MNKNNIIWIFGVTALLLFGCASPRWQIQQADYAYRNKDNPKDEYYTKNAILIDTQTGKTWIMSPSDENDVADYYWVEMREKH